MHQLEEQAILLAEAAAGSGPEDRLLLEPLCAAALSAWKARLREDAPACADALTCAAAFSAAAHFLAGGSALASFTAGDLSVHLRGGTEQTARARALEQAAERLMAPYARPADLWAKGVPG